MTFSIPIPKSYLGRLPSFKIRKNPNQRHLDQTRQLLDTSVLKAAETVLRDYRPLPFTTSQWVWKLANFYYLTHFTPQFMEVAAQKFATQQRSRLASWAWQKAKEENHHDQLALLDIQSLGYDPVTVIEAFSKQTTQLIDYFRQTVQADDPINCVGYCYAMERIAMSVRAEHVQAIADALPIGVTATRCLHTHSAIGSDTSHVNDTIEVVAGLDKKTRHRIAEACETTAFLHFNMMKEYSLSGQELQSRLTKMSLCAH